MKKILTAFFAIAILTMALSLPSPATARHGESGDKGAIIQTSLVLEKSSSLTVANASLAAACTEEKGVLICTVKNAKGGGMTYAVLPTREFTNPIGNFGRVSIAELAIGSESALLNKSIRPGFAQRRIGSRDIVLARTFTDPTEA